MNCLIRNFDVLLVWHFVVDGVGYLLSHDIGDRMEHRVRLLFALEIGHPDLKLVWNLPLYSDLAAQRFLM